MEEIKVLPITKETVQCASFVCAHPDDVGLELADQGCQLKTQWAEEELEKGFVPGFVAWHDSKPAGVFNLEHRKETQIVSIKCVWVPKKEHWDKGIATKLLEGLIKYAKTDGCFGDKPAKAIIAYPFDGGYPEQHKWAEFMVRKGFVPTPEDSCIVYYPIEPGFIYHKDDKLDGFFEDNAAQDYNVQEEDRRRILVIESPIMCPYYHVFFAKAAAKAKEIKPGIEVVFLNSQKDRAEVEKRGGFRGMVVGGHKIMAPSYYFDKFMAEVTERLNSIT